MASRVSAGILLFRRRGVGLEVLLAHPGGPYFAGKDQGHWSIPKGEVEAGEEPLAVALREFAEETGHVLGTAHLIPLGWVIQKGGKRVHAWAVEGDMDPDAASSNTFRVEWPPRSGLYRDEPEVDRVAWLSPDAARARINGAQAPFIDRLEAALAG